MGRKGVESVKRTQKTKLILHGDLEEIDLSSMCTGMNLPRTPGEVQTVRVELAVDHLEVDDDGILTVHLKVD
jgi:hypothetical protein